MDLHCRLNIVLRNLGFFCKKRTDVGCFGACDYALPNSAKNAIAGAVGGDEMAQPQRLLPDGGRAFWPFSGYEPEALELGALERNGHLTTNSAVDFKLHWHCQPFKSQSRAL